MDTTPSADPARADQARDWVRRVRDPAFADWDGFTAWLEADAGNSRAYDLAADADDRMADLLRTPPPPSFAEHPAARRPRWRMLAGGGALAACLALAVGLAVTRGGDAPAAMRAIETGPGERRTVELASGDTVLLNGDTRLLVDPAQHRAATLDRGEAVFSIRHDEAHPFVVTVGGRRLLDAGTRFEVERVGGATAVAVAEGVVVYEPDSAAVRLGAGSALRVADGDGRPVVTRIDPAAVGSWNRGTLVYADAPMDQIARDLSRNLGTGVRLGGPAASFGRFTGTLAIDGPADRALPRVASLLGAVAVRDGKDWTLSRAAD